MEGSDTQARLDAVLRADAQEVARRALRHKFGRLSNRRIIATLRAALPDGLGSEVGDNELLDRWFAEYSAAFDRLRREHLSQAS